MENGPPNWLPHGWTLFRGFGGLSLANWGEIDWKLKRSISLFDQTQKKRVLTNWSWSVWKGGCKLEMLLKVTSQFCDVMWNKLWRHSHFFGLAWYLLLIHFFPSFYYPEIRKKVYILRSHLLCSRCSLDSKTVMWFLLLWTFLFRPSWFPKFSCLQSIRHNWVPWKKLWSRSWYFLSKNVDSLMAWLGGKRKTGFSWTPARQAVSESRIFEWKCQLLRYHLSVL